jgi:hypothetical protein
MPQSEPWRRWYRWRAACLVTPSCAAISGQPILRSTARSTMASSSASAASRADRAHLSRSRTSVGDRWEGRCAEPAVSTVLCCVWLELACLALCVVRRLGLLMPSMMRDSRQLVFPAQSGPSVPGLATSPALGGTQPPLATQCRNQMRCDAHHILRHRGRWRSLADAWGLWLTSTTARHELQAFASWRR